MLFVLLGNIANNFEAFFTMYNSLIIILIKRYPLLT